MFEKEIELYAYSIGMLPIHDSYEGSYNQCNRLIQFIFDLGENTMEPMTKVTFTWTNAKGLKEQLETRFAYAREIAIELLEQTHTTKIQDVYYTIEGEITHKLDYYNTEL